MPCAITYVGYPSESEAIAIKRLTPLHLLPLTLLLFCPLVLFGCGGGGEGAPVSDGASTGGGASSVPTSCVAVESVEALRRVDGRTVTTVITAGYHRSGDGCGATYIKDTVMKNAKDNGGTVIVGEDGTRWRAMYQGALPLRLFGAVGDGRQDDTAAIRAWLAALDDGGSGYAAAGKYRFTESIVFPLRQDIAIRGDGSQQTVFLYDGSDTACDLFRIGSAEHQLHGWTLESFNIESKTKMKGGAALHIVNLKHTNRLRDVSVSRVDDRNGNNVWDGVFLENCSLTHYVGFEINCQNKGLMICGVKDSDAAADILLDQGTITFTRIGIHCGGGFGGLYIGQVLVYGCTETGYLQDNTLVERGNREIIISDQCVLDACHSYCALIDDSLSVQCTLSFNAFISGAGWIDPPTPGTGLLIKKLPQGRVSIASQHIKHCKANGIELRDNTTYVRVAATTYLVGNSGWGFYSTCGGYNVKNDALALYNGKGGSNIG